MTKKHEIDVQLQGQPVINALLRATEEPSDSDGAAQVRSSLPVHAPIALGPAAHDRRRACPPSVLRAQ